MEGRFHFFQTPLKQKSIAQPHLTIIVKIRLLRVTNLLSIYLKQWEQKIFTKEELEEQVEITLEHHRQEMMSERHENLSEARLQKPNKETIEETLLLKQEHFAFCKETHYILKELIKHPYKESIQEYLSRLLTLEKIFYRFDTLYYLSPRKQKKIQQCIPDSPLLVSEIHDALSHLNHFLRKNEVYFVAKDPKNEVMVLVEDVENDLYEPVEPITEVIIYRNHRNTFFKQITQGITTFVNSIFYRNSHNNLIDDREIELSVVSESSINLRKQ